jgi:hypothetical protein
VFWGNNLCVVCFRLDNRCQRRRRRRREGNPGYRRFFRLKHIQRCRLTGRLKGRMLLLFFVSSTRPKLTLSDAVPLNSGLLAFPPASPSRWFRLRLHHLDQLDDVGFFETSRGSDSDRFSSSRSSEDDSGSSSDWRDGDGAREWVSGKLDRKVVVRHSTSASMRGEASSRVMYLFKKNISRWL